MKVLLNPLQKTAFLSLFTTEIFVPAPFEQGETLPISVALIDLLSLPIGSRLWTPRNLTGWAFTAGLGNGDNDPATTCSLSTASSAATAPVQVVQTGGSGQNHKIRVTFSPVPYDGKWTITIGSVESALMDWDGDESDVQAAIAAMSTVGLGNVQVSQEAVGSYLIAFQGAKANTDMGTITTDPSGLLVVSTMSGTLDLRYTAVGDLLGTNDSVSTLFAIDGTPPGGTVQKLYRQPVTLYSSVIPDGGEVPNPPDQYLTSTQSDMRYQGISVAAPTSATSTGSVGQQAFDANFYYRCVNPNVWVRTALATF